MQSRVQALYRLAIWGVLGMAIAFLTSTLPVAAKNAFPTFSQIPPLAGLEGISQILSPVEQEKLDIRAVWLDGYKLFHVATPAPNSDSAKSSQSVSISSQRRVRDIQRQLYSIVRSDFDPETLHVTYKFLNDLPVIYAQYGDKLREIDIMTVTHLDAKLSRGDITTRATELSNIIEKALVRAKEQRQPEFLARQSALALGIIGGTLFLSWGVAKWQRSLKKRRQRTIEAIEAEMEAEAAAAAEQAETDPTQSLEGEAGDAAVFPTTSLDSVRQQLSRQQWFTFNEIQRRLLQIVQLVLWGANVATILRLFPYTRWLQPLLFALPLRIAIAILATYLIIRLLEAIIDRLFSALEPQELVDERTSQRIALRISTFSQVFKSVTALIGVGVAVLVTLSIIGINLTPLLAGAGIAGLALSLGAQNAIKDTINGFFILLEDQYAVGDVVIIQQMCGFVERMNLRITQLRGMDGSVITIPNGTITMVENLSKEWSRVDLSVEVDFYTNVDRALAVVNQVCEYLYYDRKWRPLMLEAPQVLGVDQISHSGMVIRIWIKTQPMQQWSVARELRRRLKNRFDREGIHIGIPQQALWFENGLDLTRIKPNGKGKSDRLTPPSSSPQE
ncbi:mechanosensitive ion channel family protein [Geitlerinema sp. PCC 9228]|uniref:mechanosensitive ion channel family protein n=1 Tax=Geitlerinema sp. PCC 9228 TaxID=111611 RepID=UPI0009FD0353|nr:mechanosensitive ion channel family protein [Geitlerinema sp. PCC 9228]